MKERIRAPRHGPEGGRTTCTSECNAKEAKTSPCGSGFPRTRALGETSSLLYQIKGESGGRMSSIQPVGYRRVERTHNFRSTTTGKKIISAGRLTWGSYFGTEEAPRRETSGKKRERQNSLLCYRGVTSGRLATPNVERHTRISGQTPRAGGKTEVISHVVLATNPPPNPVHVEILLYMLI